MGGKRSAKNLQETARYHRNCIKRLLLCCQEKLQSLFQVIDKFNRNTSWSSGIRDSLRMQDSLGMVTGANTTDIRLAAEDVLAILTHTTMDLLVELFLPSSLEQGRGKRGRAGSGAGGRNVHSIEDLTKWKTDYLLPQVQNKLARLYKSNINVQAMFDSVTIKSGQGPDMNLASPAMAASEEHSEVHEQSITPSAPSYFGKLTTSAIQIDGDLTTASSRVLSQSQLPLQPPSPSPTLESSSTPEAVAAMAKKVLIPITHVALLPLAGEKRGKEISIASGEKIPMIKDSAFISRPFIARAMGSQTATANATNATTTTFRKFEVDEGNASTLPRIENCIPAILVLFDDIVELVKTGQLFLPSSQYVALETTASTPGSFPFDNSSYKQGRRKSIVQYEDSLPMEPNLFLETMDQTNETLTTGKEICKTGRNIHTPALSLPVSPINPDVITPAQPLSPRAATTGTGLDAIYSPHAKYFQSSSSNIPFASYEANVLVNHSVDEQGLSVHNSPQPLNMLPFVPFENQNLTPCNQQQQQQQHIRDPIADPSLLASSSSKLASTHSSIQSSPSPTDAIGTLSLLGNLSQYPQPFLIPASSSVYQAEIQSNFNCIPTFFRPSSLNGRTMSLPSHISSHDFQFRSNLGTMVPPYRRTRALTLSSLPPPSAPSISIANTPEPSSFQESHFVNLSADDVDAILEDGISPEPSVTSQHEICKPYHGSPPS